MPPVLIGTLALGALQAGMAYDALKKSQKIPYKSFDDPANTRNLNENKNMFLNRSRYGMSPEERALAEGRLDQQINTSYRRGMELAGGSLGKAIQNIASVDRIRGDVSLAGLDSQIRDRNMGALAGARGALQNQTNMQLGAFNQRKLMQEQAYGRALSSGLTNLASAANFGAMAGAAKPPTDPTGTGGGYDYNTFLNRVLYGNNTNSVDNGDPYGTPPDISGYDPTGQKLPVNIPAGKYQPTWGGMPYPYNKF